MTNQDNISYIYTLSDSTGVRYVGQTNNPTARYCGHLTSSRIPKNRTNKDKWIRSLLAKNERPILNIIESCPSDKANEREGYWISYYHTKGYWLLNVPSLKKIPYRIRYITLPPELDDRLINWSIQTDKDISPLIAKLVDNFLTSEGV